jgi:hypothetical protein
MRTLLLATALTATLSLPAAAHDWLAYNPEPGVYAPDDFAIAIKVYDLSVLGTPPVIYTTLTPTRFRGGWQECLHYLLVEPVRIQISEQQGFFVAPAQRLIHTDYYDDGLTPVLEQYYCSRVENGYPIDTTPTPAFDAARKAMDDGWLPRHGAFQLGE